MESETVRRRVEMITSHFSAADNLSPAALATRIFPLNCSGALTSIKRRCDNSMHFARQDSRSQGCFMRQGSTEKDCSGHKNGSPELSTPMFSQPSSINFDVPKVRNIQHAVGDHVSPSSQPPKFARTTIKRVRDAPLQFTPMNTTHATKLIGLEKKVSPRMNVAESGGRYVLLIELPGFSIDDIRVEVDNTTLIVQTTKGKTTSCSLSDCTKSKYYRKEILEGPFEIMWPLPFDVNPDSVSAEFLDGLLRITVPKLRVPVW